jgi:hypothetical protein
VLEAFVGMLAEIETDAFVITGAIGEADDVAIYLPLPMANVCRTETLAGKAKGVMCENV